MARRAIKALADASVVIESADRESLSLHRLQSRVIRDRREEKRDVALGATLRLLKEVDPLSESGFQLQRARATELVEHLLAVLPHAESHETHATLVRVSNTAMFAANTLEDPYTVLRLAPHLEHSIRALKPDHPDTLTSRNNLAAAYQAAGDLDRAIPLFEAACEDATRILGASHPTTKVICGNLAVAQRSHPQG